VPVLVSKIGTSTHRIIDPLKTFHRIIDPLKTFDLTVLSYVLLDTLRFDYAVYSAQYTH
jgi:hypothetical protein